MRNKIASVGIMGVAVAGVVGAVSAATGYSRDTSVSIEASQLSSYAVLRDGKKLALPASVAEQLEFARSKNAGFKVAPEEARQVEIAGVSAAWLVPGSGSMCLVVVSKEGPGFSCTDTEHALDGMAQIEQSTIGEPDVVVGVAPDSVTKLQSTNDAGKVTDSAVTGNGYRVVGRGLASVVPQDARGAKVGAISFSDR